MIDGTATNQDNSQIAMERRPISFHFRTPAGSAVEKDDGAGKRRYLTGVSSGIRVDAHGERMSQTAIADFMLQANSGDILLYPDVHGFKASDDMGILTKAVIADNGDWVTEYRLYDADDGVDTQSVERADKIWRQMNGLPPYNHPQKRGFSIEGWVPEAEIVQLDETGARVINKVELDGVVVVPRPAYEDSVAHAVYKCLGETPPWKILKGLTDRLRRNVEDAEEQDAFFRKRFLLDDALEESIREIMRSELPDVEGALSALFNEYGDLMKALVLSSKGMFTEDVPDAEVRAAKTPYEPVAKADELESLFSELQAALIRLAEILRSRSQAEVA